MEWISVEDRLPDEEGYYWCYIPDQKYVNQTVLMYMSNYGFNNGNATHWMPLPEPPNELNKG